MSILSSLLDLAASSLGVTAGAATTDTVDALVTIAGLPLVGADAAAVLDVSVHQQLGQAAQATLRLSAWDADTQQLTLLDDDRFRPGQSVEIELGYLNQRAPVFSGEIIGLEFEASADARPVLTIQAYDILHRLGRGERQDEYPRSSYATIARKIASDVYSVAIDTDDDPIADPEHPIVYQESQSDLAFLTKLASEIHYELSAAPKGKTLIFRRSRVGSPPSLALDAGQDLVQFSARTDAAGQLGGVDVKALDSDSKQKIEVSIDNEFSLDVPYGSVVSRSVISNAAIHTLEEAAALASAELTRIQASYLRASGTCFGRGDLRPGLSIEITGLGPRFSGTYYVTSATHSLAATGGYRTHIELEGEPR